MVLDDVSGLGLAVTAAHLTSTRCWHAFRVARTTVFPCVSICAMYEELNGAMPQNHLILGCLETRSNS